ncbi:uncharacterized protein LOC117654143 [Thrips palmi]|uniref:Gustatory receptor n=1 Tax=Thrips palmi TaxID=161013 RepID=A0A6P9AL55_THRPL|nr:uncharacterized protein LOC117654143 [Thrips palmi]
MQALMRPTLRLARVFGMLPVDLQDGRFHWMSFATAYCVFMGSFFPALGVWGIVRSFGFQTVSNTVAMLNSMMSLLLCGTMALANVLLARHWRALCAAYDHVVTQIHVLAIAPDLRRRHRTLGAVAAGGFTLALLLLLLETWYTYPRLTPRERLILMLVRTALFGLYTVSDLLLAVVSDALTQNLRAFTALLRPAAGEEATPDFWEEARRTYGNLTDLVDFVDGKIGLMMIGSYAQSGIYLCNSLYHILRALWAESVTVSVTNFVAASIRLLCVAFYTTAVHQEWLHLKSVVFKAEARGDTARVVQGVHWLSPGKRPTHSGPED